MKILFINGSPNKNGNTKVLADKMLQGKDYETLNLTEYKIGCYGQNFADDQLDEVIGKMKEADVIVIGSPLYWHNICGSEMCWIAFMVRCSRANWREEPYTSCFREQHLKSGCWKQAIIP